jgi:GDP-L-fucose synthase
VNTLILGGHGMLGSAIDFGLKPTRAELDATDYSNLSSYIFENNITEIIHAAGTVGGVKANTDFMYDFFMDNIRMNTNVIRACKEHNINKATFFLSTCVFPHQAPLPLVEGSINDGEPHPTNFGYAYAKRMLEVGSRCLLKQHGIATSCIIPCNMYGKNDNYHLENGHVIPSLIHRCYLSKKNGTDFVVWGSGKAEREFVYADDMASVLKQIHIGHKNPLPALMIVSPGCVHTIAEVVDVIVKHIGFNGKVIFDSSKSEGILRKNTDNSLFRKHFPYFKFTDLDTGLAETIKYFVKNYETLRK